MLMARNEQLDFSESEGNHGNAGTRENAGAQDGDEERASGESALGGGGAEVARLGGG